MSVRLGELLMARGLDLETLGRFGFDGMKRGGGDECLVIPFRRDGQVVRRKYRYFDRGDDKPKWEADKGAQRLAWNEDCLRDEALRSQSLIVTEGEIDALTAIQCGFPRTISVPDGAP
ncbi:MAG: hypothetical protein JOZ27_07160, partial [Caulobacteraceae bacterium]|nr:hypothetical protein [Caulobacteraceae bacterium]